MLKVIGRCGVYPPSAPAILRRFQIRGFRHIADSKSSTCALCGEGREAVELEGKGAQFWARNVRRRDTVLGVSCFWSITESYRPSRQVASKHRLEIRKKELSAEHD